MSEPTATAIEITGLRKKYVNNRGTFRRTKVENVALAGIDYALFRLLEAYARRGGLQEAY